MSYDPRNHAATWADSVAGIVIYLLAVVGVAAWGPHPPTVSVNAPPVLVSDLGAIPKTCATTPMHLSRLRNPG